jgi:predicted RNase H-like nuclease
MPTVVVGLDWAQGKWAYCAISLNDLGQIIEMKFDLYSLKKRFTKIARIAVDAPIGLLTNDRGTGDRPCDRAARRWVANTSVVFVPPTPEQKQASVGLSPFARGILPAINAAEQLWKIYPAVIESHPEVVFSCLAGQKLPKNKIFNKKRIAGRNIRMEILAKCLEKYCLPKMGISRIIIEATKGGYPKVKPDDWLDACSMALVARAWHVYGDQLAVLRSNPNGESEPLGKVKKPQMLIALPAQGTHNPPQDELTPGAEKTIGIF